MKNILVLDGPQASDIISGLGIIRQNPKDPHSTNAFADSCDPLARKHSLTHRERIRPLDRADRKGFAGEDAPAHESKSIRQLSEEETQIGPEELAARAIIRHPALRTRDGIQLYCFRDRFPYGPRETYPDPNGQDPNHVEYWVRRMQEQFAAGEKFDAILIPSTLGPLRNDLLKPFISKLKERVPPPVIIQVGLQGNISHALADLVITDPQTIGASLRNYLGVPALPKPTAQDKRNDLLETDRQELLAQGRYTRQTLPDQYKRPGDPGYQPPGDKGRGRG